MSDLLKPPNHTVFALARSAMIRYSKMEIGGEKYFIGWHDSKIHKIYFEPTTKVNVSGGYERLSTNGYVQDYDTLFWDANSSNALSNAAQDG